MTKFNLAVKESLLYHVRRLAFISAIALPSASSAVGPNYNSILIGDRAAGMGGAFTGLSGDPSACSFYNPATLARMEGTSLSATATLYTRYDTNYGDTSDFIGASARANRGNFKSIPSSTGSVAAFGPFAFGISIVLPEYQFFSGPISSTSNVTTLQNQVDENLWVGGNIALNLDERNSIGVSMYYTSRYYQQTLIDELRTGANTRITTEEKSFTQNSFVPVIGYFFRWDSNWSAGVSYRSPSIPINGRGRFFKSALDTANLSDPTLNQRFDQANIAAFTQIPSRLNLGIAYQEAFRRVFSMDISHHFPERYRDMALTEASREVTLNPVTNLNLGAEFFLKHWLRLRLGAFTNFSATPEPSVAAGKRGTHVDMWGFSANIGVFTSDKVSFSFGGFYTGGTGIAVEQSGHQLVQFPISQQFFTMLVGSSYYF